MKPLFALVDCNNFFVSCERAFRPDLETKPVMVLSNNDGCVISRSQEVKDMDIPMGAPYFKIKDWAQKNNVSVFSCNFALYGDISHRVMTTLEQFTDEIEIYSIDEAFLQFSPSPTLLNDTQEIRRTVRRWTRIPVSIGIASTKTLAKIANHIAKKNPVYHGVFELKDEQINTYLAKLPASEVWGIGRQQTEFLRENGITQRGYPQEIIDDIASSTTPLYKQYRLPAYLEEDLKRAGVFQESILWTEWHPREPNGNVTSCAALGPLNEFEFNQYWLGKTKEQWHSHWGWEVWRLPLQKIRTFWSPGLFPFIKTGAPWSFAGSAWKEWLARASVWVSTAVVIWAGWLGLGLALKRRKPEVWLVLSILLIFTLLHSLIAGYTKYRIPLDHLLAIYAAFCLLTILDWIRGKRL
jgi:hypothetical protein